MMVHTTPLREGDTVSGRDSFNGDTLTRMVLVSAWDDEEDEEEDVELTMASSRVGRC